MAYEPKKESGLAFLNKACDILGLTSPRIRKITITADCRDAVVVQIEQTITQSEAKKLLEAVKESNAKMPEPDIVVGEYPRDGFVVG